jgi:c-di-GMP-related signal transduction protein
MFLFGLLSLIEPMLEVSVESLLKHLPLSLKPKADYLEPDSVYHRYLRLLSAMEYADGGQIVALSNELTIDTTALANACVRALAWANR